MKHLISKGVAVGLLGLAALQAQAAVTVNCPGTVATTDREFSLTTDNASLCKDFGPGNISGNPGGANPDPFLTANGAYALVDKDPDAAVSPYEADFFISGEGGNGGRFFIAAGLWNTFSALAIGFKSGEGQLDPDWAVFSLASGTTTGDWAIGGRQTLSHANLYGILKTPGNNDVPEPGSVALVAAAMLAVGATARRRRNAR